MALEFLPTRGGKLRAAISAISPRTIRISLFSLTCLLIFGVIFWRWKAALTRSASKSTVPTVDFTKPDINAAPVDLTKIGADVEIPEDHPLRKMNGVTPSGVAPFHNGNLSGAEIAQNFTDFDARLSNLERKK